MSSDYYFRKWKKTLDTLTHLVALDIEYQITKAHDKKLCDAVQRLSGMLGSYIASYNDAIECLQQNLQIQKTEYIQNVVNSIVARILELKDQIRHLEGAHDLFLTNGIIDHKLTSYDVELAHVPTKLVRPDYVKIVIDEAMEKAAVIKEENLKYSENEVIKEFEDGLQGPKWWEDDVTEEFKEIIENNEIEEKLSEETLKRKENVALIQAHERNRQVTRMYLRKKQNREMWEKELKGLLKPPASIVLRERSAQLIQKVLRFYFEIKRKRIRDCELDEKINLRLCTKPNKENVEKDQEMKSKNAALMKIYEKQRATDYERFKQKYLNRSRDDIADDYRSHVRDWFYKWYNEARVFYNIPKESEGGTIAILKEKVLTPTEWLDKYETYLEQKKANKGKTANQLKMDKQEAAQEIMNMMREEFKKKKLEAELLKKLMKNPTLHPGYEYPLSKKSYTILEAISNYHKHWHDLDVEECLSVNENYVKMVDEEKICMEVKLEVCKLIDNDMRAELKILKKSLKNEYALNEEQMPEDIKERRKKRRPRKLKTKTIDSDKMLEELIELAVKGYLKEYPVTSIEDFLGDANFAGADLRCALQRALPLGGETRALWWERCREVVHGFRRVLLVGPSGSGRSILVHAMATVNEATLYELDVSQIETENINAQYLKHLVNSLAKCARYTQPSIIYIKHVNQLYYTKVPPEGANKNFDLIKRFFMRILFKKFHKHDNVTIIGSCTDPWTTQSKQMLKKLPSVVLLPRTSYSAAHMILRNWMLNNRIVPPDLDTNSLAYLLQDYSYGYLKTALEDFLTAERIVNKYENPSGVSWRMHRPQSRYTKTTHETIRLVSYNPKEYTSYRELRRVYSNLDTPHKVAQQLTIAAYGLKVEDIFDHILEDSKAIKIDYDKYLKWYTDKTHWGKVEKKRLDEKIEFKLLEEKWKEKMEKKNKQKK